MAARQDCPLPSWGGRVSSLHTDTQTPEPRAGSALPCWAPAGDASRFRLGRPQRILIGDTFQSTCNLGPVVKGQRWAFPQVQLSSWVSTCRDPGPDLETS